MDMHVKNTREFRNLKKNNLLSIYCISVPSYFFRPVTFWRLFIENKLTRVPVN